MKIKVSQTSHNPHKWLNHAVCGCDTFEIKTSHCDTFLSQKYKIIQIIIYFFVLCDTFKHKCDTFVTLLK